MFPFNLKCMNFFHKIVNPTVYVIYIGHNFQNIFLFYIFKHIFYFNFFRFDMETDYLDCF